MKVITLIDHFEDNHRYMGYIARGLGYPLEAYKWFGPVPKGGVAVVEVMLDYSGLIELQNRMWSVPVITVGSIHDPKIARLATTLGAFRHLYKPFSWREMGRAIWEAMGVGQHP